MLDTITITSEIAIAIERRECVDDRNRSEGSQIVLRSTLVSDEVGIRKWMHEQVGQWGQSHH
jgi:hypothetical protein